MVFHPDLFGSFRQQVTALGGFVTNEKETPTTTLISEVNLKLAVESGLRWHKSPLGTELRKPKPEEGVENLARHV